MSTRSAIICKTQDGYSGIFCHFDGYPGAVGATLYLHYQNPRKVSALIALGAICFLGKRLAPRHPHSFEHTEKGATLAYGRDVKGADGFASGLVATGATVDAVASQIRSCQFVYVFEDGNWTVDGFDLGEVLLLAEFHAKPQPPARSAKDRARLRLIEILESYVAGYIAFARRRLRRTSDKATANALVDVFGFSPEKAALTAAFLKTGKGFQAACNAD